ncbi:hypothetical protein [Bacillus sp. B-jedd]|uniref:hypothetical protein n=1 Tax=Bacillus sp. B-jedd TaxID=1476857 RepID=UPI00051565D3|nr:hypothetical protein [Bacillus sp. B-jedd]CEG29595.1 hypothetical protein BN1002_04553 [Bacillus sp. B-jedd]
MCGLCGDSQVIHLIGTYAVKYEPCPNCVLPVEKDMSDIKTFLDRLEAAEKEPVFG